MGAAPRNWPAAALPRIMGPDQAAYYCGVSKNTFLRWVAAGKIPAGKKEGGRVLWDRQALDKALDSMMGVEAEYLTEEDRQRAELDRRYGHNGGRPDAVR